MGRDRMGRRQEEHHGHGASGSRVAGAAVVAGLGLLAVQAALLSAARWAWHAVSAPGTATLDQVLTLVAAAAAVLLVAWWGLATLAVVCSHLQGRSGAWCRRLVARGAPVLSRRVAAALVGVAVGGSLSSGAALAATTPPPTATSSTAAATSSTAANSSTAPTTSTTAAPSGTAGTPAGQMPTGPGWSPTAPTVHRPPVTEPDPTARRHSPSPSAGATAPADGPGWTPTRPLQRPQAPTEVLGLRPSARTTADEVVVHRGDTLWSIVARQLGADASDAEVAASWPAWHEANRAVIGADPDRLVPGQRLHAPAQAAGLR